MKILFHCLGCVRVCVLRNNLVHLQNRFKKKSTPKMSFYKWFSCSTKSGEGLLHYNCIWALYAAALLCQWVISQLFPVCSQFSREAKEKRNNCLLRKSNLFLAINLFPFLCEQALNNGRREHCKTHDLSEAPPRQMHLWDCLMLILYLSHVNIWRKYMHLGMSTGKIKGISFSANSRTSGCSLELLFGYFVK